MKKYQPYLQVGKSSDVNVLAIKRDQNGEIERFKARLVAQGFTQIEGQDFTRTFAPVAKWSSLRTILAISALRDYELRHIDVKTAFLTDHLKKKFTSENLLVWDRVIGVSRRLCTT